MLFSLFFQSALSKVYVLPPGNDKACFDIQFEANNRNVSTTFRNYGWYVAFRIYEINSDNHGLVHLVSKDTNYKFIADEINFDIKFVIDDQTGYITLYFLVKNTYNRPYLVDVGLFADVQIGNSDNAKISLLPGKRGIAMTDPITNLSYALLVRDSYGTVNVDNFYIGNYKNQYDAIDGAPFWEDGYSEYIEGNDSVLAFSWQKKIIYPDQILVLSTTSGAGKDLHFPPFVVDNTIKNKTYTQNSNITLNFTITDRDIRDKITSMSITINGIPDLKLSDHWREHLSNDKLELFGTYNLESYKTFKYEFYVTDSYNLKSNEIVNIIYLTPKPTIWITNLIESSYKKGSPIHIEGTILYDQTVYIKYKLDGINIQGGKKVECNNANKSFKSDLVIPSWINFGNRTLTIYAEDQDNQRLGYQSDHHEFNFTYFDIHSPKLNSIQLSTQRVQANETIVVNGSFYDEDGSRDSVQIWAKIGTKEYNVTDSIKASDKSVEFNFTFTIPSDMSVGETNITFYAKDIDSLNSTEVNATIVIYIPSQTPAPTQSIAPTKSIEPTTSPKPQKVNIPSKSVSLSPSKQREKIDVAPAQNKGPQYKLYILVGVIAAVIAIIVIGTVFYILKRRGSDDDEPSSEEMTEAEFETVYDNGVIASAVTLDNPLFTTTVQNDEDIFSPDFDEDDNVIGYFNIDKNQEL